MPNNHVPANNRKRLLFLFTAFALIVAACSSDDSDSSTGDDDGSTSSTDAAGSTETSEGDEASGDVIVFNGQGNNLDVYDGAPPFATQRLLTTAADDPENGLDINAQICVWEEDGQTRFIAGEDTNQPDPPAGWGIFDLEGDAVDDLEATQVGKLTPTYQEAENPENYGCGLLSDGRMVTSDIGNQALGEATGQVIVWFPPFDTYEVPYCKLDISFATAQSIWIDDDDNIFVASSRGAGDEPAGVYKYSPPYPTSPDAEGGCGGTDGTGAPLADSVDKELWIEISADTKLATPAGLAPTPDGGLYVSSVFNGVINEYDANGDYVRTIVEPPEGEELGETTSYSTGTPLGIGATPDGTLYYADIGIVVTPGELPGPGDDAGSVRRITFVDGEPQAPETMATDLAFPDGIGVWLPN